MACGDVLSLEDLQTAKKHQIFEAEVITGKVGGVAGGATIGTATNPVTGQTQQTLPSILADLGFDVQSWTSSTGGVLASANQVFLNDTSGSLGLGDYYAWGGTFPKTVPAGTDPALPASGYIMRSSRFAGTQAREALRRSYAEAGYNLVNGSFEVGGTLVNANDVMLQERTGKAFSGPAGTVAAGTNPASGGFVDVSMSYKHYNTVAEALASTLTEGAVAYTDGYYSAGDGGHAMYILVPLASYTGTPDGYVDHPYGASHVLKLVRGGVVYFEQCGVRGDGSDEATALQAIFYHLCGAPSVTTTNPPERATVLSHRKPLSIGYGSQIHQPNGLVIVGNQRVSNYLPANFQGLVFSCLIPNTELCTWLTSGVWVSTGVLIDPFKDTVVPADYDQGRITTNRNCSMQDVVFVSALGHAAAIGSVGATGSKYRVHCKGFRAPIVAKLSLASEFEFFGNQMHYGGMYYACKSSKYRGYVNKSSSSSVVFDATKAPAQWPALANTYMKTGLCIVSDTNADINVITEGWEKGRMYSFVAGMDSSYLEALTSHAYHLSNCDIDIKAEMNNVPAGFNLQGSTGKSSFTLGQQVPTNLMFDTGSIGGSTQKLDVYGNVARMTTVFNPQFNYVDMNKSIVLASATGTGNGDGIVSPVLRLETAIDRMNFYGATVLDVTGDVVATTSVSYMQYKNSELYIKGSGKLIFGNGAEPISSVPRVGVDSCRITLDVDVKVLSTSSTSNNTAFRLSGACSMTALDAVFDYPASSGVIQVSQSKSLMLQLSLHGCTLPVSAEFAKAPFNNLGAGKIALSQYANTNPPVLSPFYTLI